MKRSKILFLEIAFMLVLTGWAAYSLTGTKNTPPGGVEVTVQLYGASDKVVLTRAADGLYLYLVTENSGDRHALTADDLAARMLRERKTRSLGQSLFNVSSTFGYVWVTVGLLGQVLFTGRMVVQWLVSEKQNKSVVPPAFWWMSLIGSTMLVVYFLWRRDPIGVLGQAFGWFIYVRNLAMIYRPKPRLGPLTVAA